LPNEKVEHVYLKTSTRICNEAVFITATDWMAEYSMVAKEYYIFGKIKSYGYLH
jgi:hypothetical protein